MMWTMKKCPRCKGDTFIDDGVENCYEKCLQCGYERELVKVAASHNKRVAARERHSVN
jgi:hypothetical protein